MKYQDMISKDAVMNLILEKAGKYMESAAVNDHLKADVLADVAAEIAKMDPASAWNGMDRKPPVETLILIRIEYRELDGEIKKFIGTGTYRKGLDGSDKWMRVNGREIAPAIITGWQLMPHP